MRKRIRYLWREDKGAALALIAVSSVVLVAMTAFGTDLGWLYLNASRVQRAADAAALGGVIWVPGEVLTSYDVALDIAMRNGYDNTDTTVDVDPFWDPSLPNQLLVTVTDQNVPTFFASILGFEKTVVTRTAIAEHIPPLKLGSRGRHFGNDPSCYNSNSECAGNFWANIQGRQTDARNGDPYSSFCLDGTGNNDGCPMNPGYRDTGYLYGVIPNGDSFDLESLDMAFHFDPGGIPTYGSQYRTGDRDACDGCIGPTVSIRVYQPDPTPLDLNDSTVVCQEVYSPAAQIAPDSDPPFIPSASWVWDTVCGTPINTSSAPLGLWVVQVVHTPGDVTVSGYNRYSLRTSPGSELFGLGDFSMHNNSTTTISNFDLADVPATLAGRDFIVELYDPGDSTGGGTIQLIDPTDSIFGECRMSVRDEVDVGWTFVATLTPCQFTAKNDGSSTDYNGEWVKLESTVPPVGYTGGWWGIRYVFPGGVNDTTTWRAYMVGNTIHLIPSP